MASVDNRSSSKLRPGNERVLRREGDENAGPENDGPQKTHFARNVILRTQLRRASRMSFNFSRAQPGCMP